MFYRLIKFPAQLAIYLYCRILIVNNKELFGSKGPILIASNHPNSFLDAIIVDTLFKYPVTSLTRGDVFKNKYINKILRALNMLPIFRVSEGVENLELNYKTFDTCQHIFKQNGLVLIFSEGGCINEWHLRPLKKGTARLAINCWKEGIPLRVLPMGINYSSFRKFGKNIRINFGQFITAEQMDIDLNSGKAFITFNGLLKEELGKLVYEVDETDIEKQHQLFSHNIARWKKILLFIPAVIGFIFHAPLYYPIIAFVNKIRNDHYDSIVVGLLFLLYPIYLMVLVIVAYLITGYLLSFLLILILPFTAWCLLQLRNEI